MKGIWPGIAALLAMVLVTAGPARADTIMFKAELKAPMEMPPNDSKGIASVTATYDTRL